MNRYAVKEMFRTIQGEGLRTGTVAVFVRFSGCNLWSGLARVRDAGEGPCAKWCDTAFASGEPTELEDLLDQMEALWPMKPGETRWCVLTGGEPCLQINVDLVSYLKAAGWMVAVETNGTVLCPALVGVDHVCVSPKRGIKLEVKQATELKVVLPGAWEDKDGWTEDELEEVARSGEWEYLYIQPQDYLVRQNVVASTALVPREDGRTGKLGRGEIMQAHDKHRLAVEQCIAFVNDHPEWRLSLQTNKLVGLP